ncbi:hypothetical protein BHM03_00028850, partial [Ensete ventricosum]
AAADDGVDKRGAMAPSADVMGAASPPLLRSLSTPPSFDSFMFAFRLALVPSHTYAFVATAETMWQMRMREIESVESGPFPERPREPDCTYYLRTGLCRFGMTCRYNHPPNRQMVNLTHPAASFPP